MSVRILSGVQSGLERLHIDARRSMIAALAIILAVAGLLAPSYARSQQTPESKQKPGSGAGASFTSRADSEISTGAGVQLKRTKFEKHYGGTDYSFIKECPGTGGISDAVSAGSTSSFCYGSYEGSGALNVDTGFFFYFDILIPNGTGGWRRRGLLLHGGA